VVLHGHQTRIGDHEPLTGTVVEVDVRDLRCRRQRKRIDGVPVILRGHLDLTGAQIPDRVVGSVVPELELERRPAQRPRGQLESQADPEDRNPPEQTTNRLDRAVERGRVPGPLDRNTASGRCARTSSAVEKAGTTVRSNPVSCKIRRMLVLAP